MIKHGMKNGGLPAQVGRPRLVSHHKNTGKKLTVGCIH